MKKLHLKHKFPPSSHVDQRLVHEVKRFRDTYTYMLLITEIAVTCTAKEVRQFVVKWDFTESTHNFYLILQDFLTSCVSVASCERDFSKLKLTKFFLDQWWVRKDWNTRPYSPQKKNILVGLWWRNIFSKIKARKYNLVSTQINWKWIKLWFFSFYKSSFCVSLKSIILK